MRDCVTHHYACDCREEKFKNIQAENENLKSSNDELRRYLSIEIGGHKSTMGLVSDLQAELERVKGIARKQEEELFIFINKKIVNKEKPVYFCEGCGDPIPYGCKSCNKGCGST